ncbi:Uncharacterised protein [Enterobacter hormaechei]|nr:Uncharacterised protein [Enterobacter hormaechei]
MSSRVFKQRAAAQKCGGWRCDLYNAAIAINLLPAVAGDLTSAVDYLMNRLNLTTFIANIGATGVETAAGGRISRVR